MSTKVRSGGADSDEVADAGSVWSRVVVAGADWPDKDELLDVVYWLRQFWSALIGLVWGLVPFHGVIAVLLYVAISTALGHVYVTSFQNVDDEALGGFWELAKEGFGSAFATFMVAWIITYSSLYH